MKSLHLLLPLLLLPLCHAFGQQVKPFTIKTEFIGLLKNRFKLEGEWRFNRKSAIECGFSFRKSSHLSSDAFNGDWNNEYALRRTYAKSSNTNVPYYDTGWELFGDGKPLPEWQGSTAYNAVMQFSFGYRQYYPLGKHLEMFIQPTIMVAHQRAFELLEDVTFKTTSEVNTWEISNELPEKTMIQETTFFKQSRKMRFKDSFIGGPSYGLGLCYRIKNVVLEGKLNAGLNFSELENTNSHPLVDMRRYYAQCSVSAGYSF